MAEPVTSKLAVCEGLTEAGARRGDEGPVAGATVEDQPVAQDQSFEADRKRFRHVDGEALVVVPGRGDVAFEEDFVAEQFESEACGFPLFGDDVVDVGFGHRFERRQSGAEQRGFDLALPDFGTGGTVGGARFEGRQGAAFGGAGVDAEADRQLDPHVFQFAHRGLQQFEGPDLGRRVLDDELGEGPRRVRRGFFEELARRGDRAFGRDFGRFRVTRPRLPSRVDRRRMRIATRSTC